MKQYFNITITICAAFLVFACSIGPNGEEALTEFENTLKEKRFEDALNMVQESDTLANYSHPGTGRNALYLAVSYDQTEIVRQLLDQGMDVAINSSNNMHIPIFAANNLEMFKLLVEAGSPLRHPESKNHSALFTAVKIGDLESVQYLIEKGADINLRSTNGVYPIDFARIRSNQEIVQYLSNAGATGEFDDTFDVSLYRELGSALRTGKYEKVPGLLKAGAPVRERTLVSAMITRTGPNVEIFEMLMEQQETITMLSLKKAMDALPLKVFSEMLAKAENKNPVDDSMGWSLIELAVIKGEIDHTRILLDAGVDPNTLCSGPLHKGTTLLAYAEKEGHTEIAALLRQRGAK